MKHDLFHSRSHRKLSDDDDDDVTDADFSKGTNEEAN